MTVPIREFKAEDYRSAYDLWAATPGMGLSDADEPAAIMRYLKRNPGLSFVAEDGRGGLAGTVLCGHDGRRGFLYHLAVKPEHRARGIGKALVNAALAGLAREGINKCHIMVIADNEIGRRFWDKAGWQKRDGLHLYSTAVDSAGLPCSSGNDECPC